MITTSKPRRTAQTSQSVLYAHYLAAAHPDVGITIPETAGSDPAEIAVARVLGAKLTANGEYKSESDPRLFPLELTAADVVHRVAQFVYGSDTLSDSSAPAGPLAIKMCPSAWAELSEAMGVPDAKAEPYLVATDGPIITADAPVDGTRIAEQVAKHLETLLDQYFARKAKDKPAQ